MERPAHELLWLCCAAKRCCSVRTVLPTGADIWRIATALDVPPQSFLRPVAAQSAVEGAFLLGPERQPFHAALARRVVKSRPAACVFLVQLGEHAARCGLDGLRPLPCHAFPAVGDGQIVRVSDEQPCSCRTWALADLDRPHIAAVLHQEQGEREAYHEVIRAWNARIAEHAAPCSFADFCDYLLDAYAQPVRGAL